MNAEVGNLLIAVGCIVGGLAVIPFVIVPTHSTALTIDNYSFIGTGAAETFACLFGNPSWSEFWKKLGIGAFIGLITTGASFIAINYVKRLDVVATQLENNFNSNISKHDISALLSAGSAIVSTGATNLIEGGLMVTSAFFGGLLTYGMVSGLENFFEKIVRCIRKLCQITSQHMNKVGRLTITNFLKLVPMEIDIMSYDGSPGYSGSGSTNIPLSNLNKERSKVLEPRIWNEVARIYSTRDAIETFRSQSERYNYSNIVPEFNNEVNYTSINTRLNLPCQSNQNSANNIFNQSITINEKNSRLPVILHPIICWNTEQQKYTFSNRNEWPTFPNKAKIVGFIGTKKSGRTTAIHSLLFELGYYLTEEQLAKSLLPVGVMMYVLTKYDLVLLDCCDAADSTTAEAGNLLSGYLLEFFTYMASCHLVIHTAIPQKTEASQYRFSEKLASYIHAKAKLQLLWASTIQTRGPSMLTVLVRGSKQQCEEFDIAKKNLFSSRTNFDSEDNIVFTQGFQDSKAFTWQYIPEEMTSIAESRNNNFAAILRRIKDETKPHGLSANAQSSGVTDEPRAINANWQHLFSETMSNSILSQSVTDMINYDMIQEADDKTNVLIQEYINSANRLVENSTALAIGYKSLCEDFKRRIDIEMNKPDNDKDPIIGFKISIEIAKYLLESSKSETNLQTKNNLITWGLHGLTLIHNRSLKTHEHTWMKLCIKTYNILDLLNTPVIYNVYWHCWNFLSFASSCGFKLELVEWQILGRALHCLKTSSNKPQFHFHVLNCLLNLLETEPYLPVRICPQSTGDENNQTSSIKLNEEQYYRLKEIAYHGIAEYSKKCVREAAERRQSTNMEKYLEEIKSIVSKQFKVLANSLSLCTTPSQNEFFSTLGEYQQFSIVSAALARLNTDIALYVSKHIINENLIDLFSMNSPIEMSQNYHEIIRSHRWLFLQRIARLQDEECTRNLIENTLPWVIDYIKKFPHSERHDSYAVLFVNTLVVAESAMKKHQQAAEQRKSQSFIQPTTLSDIQIKKRKLENEGEFGGVRMELLSQSCLKPILKELLYGLKTQDLKSDKVRRYASFIDNLLFAPLDSKIQALSLGQISIHDQNELRLMVCQMMDLCVKTFWQHSLEKKELDATNQVSIIHNMRALLRLLNRVYWIIAKNNQFEIIRGSYIIFGSQGHLTSGSIHSLVSSDDTHSSETLADKMIQRIGLNNWLNLIILTSIPHVLSDHISKIDPDNSLNLHETAFDVRDDALILLWNFAECSDVSLKGSKNVMTTINFRSMNVICELSDKTFFDDNGINRVKFLIDRVLSKINANPTAGEFSISEITTQELCNRFETSKMRAIKLKRHVEISENVEKQMEEQRLRPNEQAMREARLRKFDKK